MTPRRAVGTMRESARWRWLIALAAFVAIANLMGLEVLRWLPACPLRSLTGLLCPLCGSTRAVLHLARGEWSAAWSSNPLVVAGIGGWGGVALARAVLGERWIGPGLRARRLLAIGGMLVLLVFGVGRNL